MGRGRLLLLYRGGRAGGVSARGLKWAAVEWRYVPLDRGAACRWDGGGPATARKRNSRRTARSRRPTPRRKSRRKRIPPSPRRNTPSIHCNRRKMSAWGTSIKEPQVPRGGTAVHLGHQMERRQRRGVAAAGRGRGAVERYGKSQAGVPKIPGASADAKNAGDIRKKVGENEVG